MGREQRDIEADDVAGQFQALQPPMQVSGGPDGILATAKYTGVTANLPLTNYPRHVSTPMLRDLAGKGTRATAPPDSSFCRRNCRFFMGKEDTTACAHSLCTLIVRIVSGLRGSP
jgi:hypothetical protein